MSGLFRARKTSHNIGKKDRRMEFIRLIFIMSFLAIVLRLFFIQVVQGSFYAALASGQHEIYKTLFPERGGIFVRENNSLAGVQELYPLATNREYKTVYAQPKFISDPKSEAESLSPILGLSVEDLMIRLDKPNDPYEVIARKLDPTKVTAIEGLNLSGIKFQDEVYRYYPEKNITSSLTGFVSQQDDERRGQYGLEGYFDDILRGQAGSLKSEKDLSGRWIASTNKFFTPAINGADIILTIDKTIQYQACKILRDNATAYEADSAALIIMDPYSGKILAMCSYPDYDPNEYNKVEDVSVYNNTTIFTPYEPGSVFKPIGMAAGLDLNVITPDTTYIDNGEIKIDKFTIRNADKKAHGLTNMVTVLDESLNLGMIFVVQQLGTARYKQYVKNFGFGEPIGLQLATEVSGTIASLDKKGDIYTMTASYGQGLTATPLQMIQSYAAIANGGYLVKPYIIDEIRYPDHTEVTQPKVIRKVLDQKTSTLLGGMMVSVIKHGHGKSADVKGYNVAGKSGTAQIADFVNGGYSTRSNNTFIGYAPVDNPAFVMLVKYEDPKNGYYAESNATPTFGQIAKYLLQYMKVQPDNPDN